MNIKVFEKKIDWEVVQVLSSRDLLLLNFIKQTNKIIINDYLSYKTKIRKINYLYNQYQNSNDVFCEDLFNCHWNISWYLHFQKERKKIQKNLEKEYQKEIIKNFNKYFPNFIFIKDEYIIKDWRIDILAKNKDWVYIIFELKQWNNNWSLQLLTYALEFGNPILIHIWENIPKRRHDSIIYYTYKELWINL